MNLKHIYRIKRGVITVITTLSNRLYLKLSGGAYGKSFGTCGFLFIRNYASNDGITIGDDVFINSCRLGNPIGGDTKTIMFVSEHGHILIGNGVKMSNVTFFSTKGISIGDSTYIGGGTRIYDSDFHSCNPEDRLNGNSNIPSSEVLIGKKCFIGSNVLILKGVTIGDKAVVGANSVVTKDIPSGQVWAGCPAQFIKNINYK